MVKCSHQGCGAEFDDSSERIEGECVYHSGGPVSSSCFEVDAASTEHAKPLLLPAVIRCSMKALSHGVSAKVDRFGSMVAHLQAFSYTACCKETNKVITWCWSPSQERFPHNHMI